MNNHVRKSNMNTKPTTERLLDELKHETGMAHRQLLLKALWRLEQRIAQSSIKSTVSRHRSLDTISATRQGWHTDRLRRSPSRGIETLGDSSTASHDTRETATAIMNEQQMLPILNDLFAIEKFSLASYLRYAPPWSKPDEEPLRNVIRDIGGGQQQHADRVGLLILEHRGHVEGGSFPMRFTAFNDLSLDYVARRVMEDQERIVREVRMCVDNLAGAPIAHSLALEILGAEQAHLDSLCEVLDGDKSDAVLQSKNAGLNETRSRTPGAVVATAA